MTDNGANRGLLSWLRQQLRASNLPDHPETNVKDHLIYAVGDIHGRHDLLISLLETIRVDMVKSEWEKSANSKIYLVFLGDYIDRGHHSKQVIESLYQLTFESTEIVFLKGNHEAVALDFMDPNNLDTKWLQYGGRETLSSYGVKIPKDYQETDKLIALKAAFADALPATHLDFMRKLKSYWILGKYMFVHAGVDPGQAIELQSDDEYLWIRNPFLESVKKLPYIVVHGHTPTDKPVWDGRRIGIDTGAYISNRLTAVRLHNDQVSFLST